MAVDPKQMIFLVGAYSVEGLDRAKELAQLAEADSDEHRGCTLSGMALVLAVSSLATIVEHRLLYALAQATAEGGNRPDSLELQRRLRGGTEAQLHQLPSAEVGMDLGFAVRKPRAARLVLAVRLRNHLIHYEGAVVTDPELVRVREDGVDLQVPLPENPWTHVTRCSGVDAVADATDYLNELDRFKGNGPVTVPEFFMRVSGRAG